MTCFCIDWEAALNEADVSLPEPLIDAAVTPAKSPVLIVISPSIVTAPPAVTLNFLSPVVPILIEPSASTLRADLVAESIPTLIVGPKLATLVEALTTFKPVLVTVA